MKLESCRSIAPSSEEYATGIQCGVCMGRFHPWDAGGLECSHTFCHLCLVQLIQIGSDGKESCCPLCRQPLAGLEKTGIGGTVLGLQQYVKCLDCERKDVANAEALFCNDCCKCLCADCSKSENKHAKHEIVPFSSEQAIQLCIQNWTQLMAEWETWHSKMEKQFRECEKLIKEKCMTALLEMLKEVVEQQLSSTVNSLWVQIDERYNQQMNLLLSRVVKMNSIFAGDLAQYNEEAIREEGQKSDGLMHLTPISSDLVANVSKIKQRELQIIRALFRNVVPFKPKKLFERYDYTFGLDSDYAPPPDLSDLPVSKLNATVCDAVKSYISEDLRNAFEYGVFAPGVFDSLREDEKLSATLKKFNDFTAGYCNTYVMGGKRVIRRSSFSGYPTIDTSQSMDRSFSSDGTKVMSVSNGYSKDDCIFTIADQCVNARQRSTVASIPDGDAVFNISALHTNVDTAGNTGSGLLNSNATTVLLEMAQHAALPYSAVPSNNTTGGTTSIDQAQGISVSETQTEGHAVHPAGLGDSFVSANAPTVLGEVNSSDDGGVFETVEELVGENGIFEADMVHWSQRVTQICIKAIDYLPAKEQLIVSCSNQLFFLCNLRSKQFGQAFQLPKFPWNQSHVNFVRLATSGRNIVALSDTKALVVIDSSNWTTQKCVQLPENMEIRKLAATPKFLYCLTPRELYRVSLLELIRYEDNSGKRSAQQDVIASPSVLSKSLFQLLYSAPSNPFGRSSSLMDICLIPAQKMAVISESPFAENDSVDTSDEETGDDYYYDVPSCGYEKYNKLLFMDLTNLKITKFHKLVDLGKANFNFPFMLTSDPSGTILFLSGYRREYPFLYLIAFDLSTLKRIGVRRYDYESCGCMVGCKNYLYYLTDCDEEDDIGKISFVCYNSPANEISAVVQQQGSSYDAVQSDNEEEHNTEDATFEVEYEPENKPSSSNAAEQRVWE